VTIFNKDKKKDVEETWVKDEIVSLLDAENKPYNLNALVAMITKKPTEVEIKQKFTRAGKAIKQPPVRLIGQNTKIEKSGFDKQVFYDFTLPAYHGVFYDEQEKKWKKIITCPNAGGCKGFCYAASGGYIQFETSAVNSARMLNFILNHPDEFKKKMIKDCIEISASLKEQNKQLVLRWHDSGDFFSIDYLKMALAIAKATPNVLHYAYTKRYDLVRKSEIPENFVFNHSVDPEHEGYHDYYQWTGSDGDILGTLMNAKGLKKTKEEAAQILEDIHRYRHLVAGGRTKVEAMQEINHDSMIKKHMDSGLTEKQAEAEIAIKHVDTKNEKHSQVVPKEVFANIGKKLDTGYVFSKSEIAKLKVNLAKYYIGKGKPGYDSFIASLKTWDDLETLPESKPNQYNVMVYAGHGDDAAARRDVLGTYLFIH
jgi:predicted Zn-ribbon and HTH transcriptional regulator